MYSWVIKRHFQFFFAIIFTCCSTLCFAQEVIVPNSDTGFSAVVGAFRIKSNAVNFHRRLISKGFSSSMIYDETNHLHYVRIGEPTDKAHARNEVLKLREDKAFSDAWVKLFNEIKKEDQNQVIPSLVTDENIFATEQVNPAEELKQKVEEFTISSTEVFLHLYNAVNDKVIDGDVQVIDTERARLIEKVKGNEYYNLPDPKSKSKQITLIGEVFGYRKVQFTIPYPLPADTVSENVEMVGTIAMIRFDMVRLLKGDISILYNVYFYNDASVMQSESRYELNNLLTMMQENQKYRIRLHGHTNGGASGKILTPGEDKNLFSLTNAQEEFGTAKELSYKRAKTIREFLVANGVAEDRVEIKAWGGKKPLYDKNSANAKRNVRVEVEILSE